MFAALLLVCSMAGVDLILIDAVETHDYLVACDVAAQQHRDIILAVGQTPADIAPLRAEAVASGKLLCVLPSGAPFSNGVFRLKPGEARYGQRVPLHVSLLDPAPLIRATPKPMVFVPAPGAKPALVVCRDYAEAYADAKARNRGILCVVGQADDDAHWIKTAEAENLTLVVLPVGNGIAVGVHRFGPPEVKPDTRVSELPLQLDFPILDTRSMMWSTAPNNCPNCQLQRR